MRRMAWLTDLHLNFVTPDRIDRLSAQYLGDPLAYWRLCDANGVLQPEELTANPGSTIAIPLPAGVGTASGA